MALGTTIANRYRIDRTIGHGGMGDIYVGTDLKENRIVAIKRLKRELSSIDPSIIQRFLREGEVQKRLKHPNVVQIFDVFQDEDDHFLIMEYVGGGTLSELIHQETRLPLRQTLEIAYHISLALVVAHDHQVVHRDLKPANILMMPNGMPKLTDFGAARIDSAHRLTVTGMVIGTYSYMSPESCKGEDVDMRADVWSFGIMLFEMLTQSRPFSQDNPMQLMLAIMREPPTDIQKLNSEIPDNLADLVYRMLAKDRDQRIPSMSIVVNELNLMLEKGFSSTQFTSLSTRFFAAGTTSSSGELRLPTYGPLVGREKIQTEVVELLSRSETNLITILGSGGIGKTHLAVDVAQSVSKLFRDGTYFVDFTDVKDAQVIPTSIATALKFQFFGAEDPISQLADYLQKKEVLLILDNFEQLTAGSDFLLTLLKRAPQLKFILTSRARLNLRDEWSINLDGLDTEAKIETDQLDNRGKTKVTEAAAYRLFVQKARKIRSDFAPTKADREAIYQICRLVDGSPLAIELAAGWVSMLMPQEILEEMTAGMDFLETNLRDVPERHRSIRSISENSWKLLNDDERDALARLSVFRGGYRREAIRQVVGASLLTLNSLIDKSLLRRSPESGLYSMQEMLRWFAAQKLQEQPEVERDATGGHARYYLERLHQLTPELIGGGQLEALSSIERRLPNIQIAVHNAVEAQELELVEYWIDSMFNFYMMRGRQREGGEAIRQVTFGVTRSLPSPNHILQVKLMSRLGAYSRFIGELDSAQALLTESLKLARELELTEEVAFGLYQLGATRPRLSNALGMWEEAFEIAEKAKNSVLLAETANWLAFNCFETGNINEAIKWLERGLAERRKLGDKYGLAIILTNLGFVHMQIGDFGKSKRFLREALEINKKLRNYYGIAAAYNNLSYIALHTNELNAAHTAATQACRYFDKVGNKRGKGEALGNLIDIALKEHDLDAAEQMCHECIALFTELDLPTHDYQTRLAYIALDRYEFESAQQQFLELLSEDSRLSIKLEILAGIAKLMIQDDSISESRLSNRFRQAAALLRFILDHQGTDQVIKGRANQYLDELKRKGGLSTAQLNTGPFPETLEKWVTLVQKEFRPELAS